MKRHNERSADELRPLRLTYNAFGFAPGSVLLEVGNTKLLCSVSLQNTVPPFLRGKDTGWLTAEYALLPSATMVRTQRESSTMKRQGRSVEISRLIGRALRMAVDCSQIRDRTIVVDCDVLQADGGTRTAAITGAYYALVMAQEVWLSQGIIQQPFLIKEIAAVSVGLVEGSLFLDLDYQEDSKSDADINIIMTRSGDVVEIQGGAEKEAISWETFTQVGFLAQSGIQQLFNFFENNRYASNKTEFVKKKAPLFSLKNRSQRSEISK